MTVQRDAAAGAQAEALGIHPLQAHCHRDLGTLYAAPGRPARAALGTARALYQAMAMPGWRPETQAARA